MYLIFIFLLLVILYLYYKNKYIEYFDITEDCDKLAHEIDNKRGIDIFGDIRKCKTMDRNDLEYSKLNCGYLSGIIDKYPNDKQELLGKCLRIKEIDIPNSSYTDDKTISNTTLVSEISDKLNKDSEYDKYLDTNLINQPLRI